MSERRLTKFENDIHALIYDDFHENARRNMKVKSKKIRFLFFSFYLLIFSLLPIPGKLSLSTVFRLQKWCKETGKLKT